MQHLEPGQHRIYRRIRVGERGPASVIGGQIIGTRINAGRKAEPASQYCASGPHQRTLKQGHGNALNSELVSSAAADTDEKRAEGGCDEMVPRFAAITLPVPAKSQPRWRHGVARHTISNGEDAGMQKWQLVLLVGAMAFGCGADTIGDSEPAVGAGGSSTGGTDSAGASAGTSDAGAAGTADSGGASTTGGQAPTGGGTPSGGQSAEAGGAGGEDECDTGLLWETVTRNNGVIGACFPWNCGYSGYLLPGAIRFDAEGRVTDVTGLYPEEWATDEWQQFIADNRWPCYANQTLAYCCQVAS